MQKEIEDLKKESISKQQLDKLVLGSVGNYGTESENSDERESSSYGDETDGFDESLENDLGTVGWNSEEEEALSLESEEASLNEDESAESDDLGKSVGSAEQPGISTSSMSFQKEGEYILKLKEIQDEVNNLKEMIEEFARDIKSSLTELIFDQLSQLESELFGEETIPKGDTENEPVNEEKTGGDEVS